MAKLQKGINDLETLFPEIAKEWHPTKNGDLKPCDFLPGSNQQVWWLLPYDDIVTGNHFEFEWKCTIYNRTKKGHGCPFFSSGGRTKLYRGYNDLATTCPDLIKEWDYEKNTDISPDELLKGAGTKVWWKCQYGHSWKASPYARSGKAKTNCPFCAGQMVSKEKSIAVLFPEIAEEWDYEKNAPLTPEEVGKGSIKKVWWKCRYGHSWKTTTNHRTALGNSCPICSACGTSIAEQGVAFYVEQKYEIESRAIVNGVEIDIYIPAMKIGIEYDGVYYHSSSENLRRELAKNEKLKKAGIKLIRIKETRDDDISVKVIDDIIFFNSSHYLGNEYENAISSLFEIISENSNHDIDINVKRDFVKIRERCDFTFKSNSFATNYPDIACEWNYEKNGTLIPEMFSAKSTQKVWWKCQYGHTWYISISHRARGDSCPYCSGRIAIKGVNDLATLYPNISNEWDYEKNAPLTPEEVGEGSHKKVWWKCKDCEYSWEAIIYSRTSLKTGCPQCARKRIEMAHYVKIKNLDTGEVFNSVKDAATKYNITAANISACCSSRRNIAGGFHWRKVD